ncbi:Copper resistance protein CopC [Cupriavidus gilardii CR3]|nr:Copper resistance protein CopC [Cupriavidus gilardii CR3]
MSAPQKIELKFSENLATQFSGANLVMPGMPGMANHAPMKVAAKVSGSDDPKTMVITPAQSLAPGSYRVEWRAVSSDTHPITGNIAFTVK